MMSEAEEMLLATSAQSSNAPGLGLVQVKALNLEHSKYESGDTVPSKVAQAPSKPSSPARRPAHEGDHVRNTRLSTSDARKADHEVSSRIVALSSNSVADADPPAKTLSSSSRAKLPDAQQRTSSSAGHGAGIQ